MFVQLTKRKIYYNHYRNHKNCYNYDNNCYDNNDMMTIPTKQATMIMPATTDGITIITIMITTTTMMTTPKTTTTQWQKKQTLKMTRTHYNYETTIIGWQKMEHNDKRQKTKHNDNDNGVKMIDQSSTKNKTFIKWTYDCSTIDQYYFSPNNCINLFLLK